MTVQQAKSLFEGIAIKLVNHNPAKTKSQFFMFDEEDFTKVSKIYLDLNKMCIEVSYPMDEIFERNSTHFIMTKYIVNISRIVPLDNFEEQLVCLEEAKNIGLKLVKYLYWYQRKNNGFRIMPGTETKFDHTRFDLKPLISTDVDNSCGRQMTLIFNTVFDFCDAAIEADIMI